MSDYEQKITNPSQELVLSALSTIPAKIDKGSILLAADGYSPVTGANRDRLSEEFKRVGIMPYVLMFEVNSLGDLAPTDVEVPHHPLFGFIDTLDLSDFTQAKRFHQLGYSLNNDVSRLNQRAFSELLVVLEGCIGVTYHFDTIRLTNSDFNLHYAATRSRDLSSIRSASSDLMLSFNTDASNSVDELTHWFQELPALALQKTT